MQLSWLCAVNKLPSRYRDIIIQSLSDEKQEAWVAAKKFVTHFIVSHFFPGDLNTISLTNFSLDIQCSERSSVYHIFSRVFNIANQPLTRHSPFAPFGHVDERTAKPSLLFVGIFSEYGC